MQRLGSYSVSDMKNQELRESFGEAYGAERYRARLLKSAQIDQVTTTPQGHAFVARNLEDLVKTLKFWMDDRTHTRGPRNPVEDSIKSLGVETVAYIAFKAVVDGVLRTHMEAQVARRIAAYLYSERRYRALKEQAPALYQYKLENFHTSSYVHMAKSLDHAVRTAKTLEGKLISVVPDPSERIQFVIGTTLIQLIHHTYPELFELVPTKRGRELRTTPAIQQLLFDRPEWWGMLEPCHVPMVVPPMEWSPGRRGGYRFAWRGRTPLARKPWASKAEVAAFELRETPVVHLALNRLQATGWTINRTVYELVQTLMEHSHEWRDQELPPKPADIDTNEEARRVWRRRAAQVRNENHVLRAKRLVARATLDVASGLLDEAVFFFPYSLDFRGRIYPNSDLMHPQGDDLARSLLLFAEGKPLDEQGARWLAIHGANKLGEYSGWKASKSTLDERVQWIHDHTRQIEQAADEPMAHQWWMQAEDPLQFYAFCVEWAAFLHANAKDQEYVCTLPVSMDGSCNGLQHFAALWRDEVGGEAVNLIPAERPQDVYERIAQRVVNALEQLPDEPVAVQILAYDLVTRTLCKRPTMTFGYGSKRFGFRSQILTYLRALPDWKELRTRVKVKDAASLLARLIWEALQDTVVKAHEGMQWFQQCARQIVKADKLVEWLVPGTNFLVKQDYREYTRERLAVRDNQIANRVETALLGRITLQYSVATKRPARHRQVNAISPNIVHSLDAAVLMLTVAAAPPELQAFAMVHDSYGTLPTDCSTLAEWLRRVFVQYYSKHNVVELLREQFTAQTLTLHPIPQPPTMGNLNLQSIINSQYFFA